MARTAVVTGGTRGIGRAVARALARDGWQLVLNYRVDESSAASTLQELEAFGAAVVLVKADVSDRDGVEQLITATVAHFGSIGVLVNNAARNIDGPFLDMSDEVWSAVLNANLSSVFMCSQAAARVMLGGDGGVIVNVGSTTAIRGRMNGANYCAAKAGVLVLTKCLALELAPRVRVNCVIPGSIQSSAVPDPARSTRVAGSVPLGRLGVPEEVAEAVAFLVSDRARYVTGQKLIVDGGQFMY